MSLEPHTKPSDWPGLVRFDAEPSELRREIKCVAALTSLEEIEALLGEPPLEFQAAYPPCTVHNLYWDTPGFTYYRRHVDGETPRHKIRLRWYSDGRERSPRVEIKSRFAERSVKHVFPLAPGVDLSRDRFLSPSVPEPLQIFFRSLTPTLSNQYRRRYLYSPTTKIRATVDTEVGFAVPEAGAAVHTLPMAIVEFKFFDEAERAARECLGRLPFRFAAHSKYVTGIRLLLR